MVYLQDVPRRNDIYSFNLRDFSGGLNNHSELLKPNEASDLMNMKFTDAGIMEKRNGIKLYHDYEVDEPITSIYEYRPYNEDDMLLYATDSAFYLGDIKIRDLEGKFRATNFNGKLIFIDGDKMYTYGKFPQEESEYEKIKGVAVDGYVVLEIVNPPENYTPLDSSHKEGVTHYDYENEKVWYEPCKNESEDPYLGANVLPEKSKYSAVHKGRLYVSGSDEDDDNVFISDVRNPYYYPVGQPLQLPPNSDKVTGLVVYDDAVIVGRHNDIYAIRGETANPQLGLELFTLNKLNTHTGFVNNESVSVAHSYLIYLGFDGNVYGMSSVNQEARVITTTVISKQLNLFKEPFGLTKADLTSAEAFFIDDEWYLSIGDYTFVYSYLFMAWTVYNGMNARSFASHKGTLIWGSDNGRTLCFSDDYLDEGKPFEAFWQSMPFDMDDAHAEKRFKDFFITAYTYDDFKSDIRVQFDVDYVRVDNRAFIENQVSRWGSAVFGDRFIMRNIVMSNPFIVGRRGRTIRFRFTNCYDADGSVETHDDLRTYVGRKDDILVYVEDEDSYYLYYEREWHKMTDEDLNQPMRLYQISGEYEFRGKW